ncbi:MAG: helix-turn-helix transcriptional regulator [Chitinophagaceae bacterium]
MATQLPKYSICSLSGTLQANDDFIADRLAHYIEEHRNLKFPHKHSFYHLVYFTSGKGKHAIDFVEFDVQPGQVYFMIPEQVHTWHFEGTTDGYIVNFTDRFLNQLIVNPRYLDQFSFFSGIAENQVVDIPPNARKSFESILQQVVDEGKSGQPYREDYIQTLLVQLFIGTARCCTKAPEKNTPYNSVLLHNFKKLIDQYYKEKRLPRHYAGLLYITPNHLNALTKDATGRSAGELIRDRVMLEAKRLLVNADMSISEIALELDFADNSNFSKFFKKHAGCSPEAFRKQLK